MSKSYTQRTAALKTVILDASTIDAKKLLIYPGKGDKNDRINIIELISQSIADAAEEYFDERGENKTEHDIWGHYVESKDGKTTIHHKWLTGSLSDEIRKNITKISNNKATDKNNNLVVNIEVDRLKDGTGLFYSSTLEKFIGDLSNLEIAGYMFANTSLTSIETSFKSLVDAIDMFRESQIVYFSNDLNEVLQTDGMFKSTTKLKTFNSNMNKLLSAKEMFCDSTITSFDASIPYLYDGRAMFSGSNIQNINASFSNLLDGFEMFRDTNLSLDSLRVIAETLPAINAFNYKEDGSKEYVWANGINIRYQSKQWNETLKDTKNINRDLSISPKTIGEITITWKDTSVLTKEEKAIAVREYFKLMNLKGWTVITNLCEEGVESDTIWSKVIDGITYEAPFVHFPTTGLPNKGWSQQ
jgi:hypothetical protein